MSITVPLVKMGYLLLEVYRCLTLWRVVSVFVLCHYGICYDIFFQQLRFRFIEGNEITNE